MEFVGNSKEKLNVLRTDKGIFIGRKKSVMEKYSEEGALFIGRSVEKDSYGKKVFMDAVSPHVVFITGARGSGKSYTAAVIAEELVEKNPNVAAVIIDPIGIFWSMKYPNKEEKEIETLSEWGLEPRGIENVKVFIPYGLRNSVPKNTYDALFSLRPAELNVEDWCLTFGIERFSPTGLLLEKAIEKAGEKYKNYSLDELIKTIETDKELTSKEKGFKSDSRRALTSRLEAAKSWGVFSKEGTSLAEVCREGHVSIVDISFLEENVASLIIGMLARKILNARKLVTRQAAMKKYVDEVEDIEEILNVEIPPTWLFIDEAHTLIPSGSAKTAATDALIEYVKQGRRPGCSLVFATQQPSAIDTRVLSQLDLLFCHKLVFDEDVKAVMRRMPTSIPKEYSKGGFVKTLPIGIALVGDRSDETSRAFCVQTRPRYSQHEGREERSIELEENISEEKIRELITSLVLKKVKQSGRMSLAKINSLVETISSRYKKDIKAEEIIEEILKNEEIELKDGALEIPGYEEMKKTEAEIGETKALKQEVSKAEAERIAEKNRKKPLLFGKAEELKSLETIYKPVLLVKVRVRVRGGYSPRTMLFDGEKVYLKNKKKEDLSKLLELREKHLKILSLLEKPRILEEVMKETGSSKQTTKKYLNELVRKKLADERGGKYYSTAPKLADNKYHLQASIEKPRALKVEKAETNEDSIIRMLEALGIEVEETQKVLKPFWRAAYELNGVERVFEFDAF